MDFLLNSQYLGILLVIIFSPLVGSFLNVVIYRLPIMLQKSWREECVNFLKDMNGNYEFDINHKNNNVDLLFPNSFCPNCHKPIKPYDNIPIISYLILLGRCRSCKIKISLMYPFIEALTLITSFLVVLHFGISIKTLLSLVLTWILIVLAGIDYKHYILPDNITIPGIWLGLIINCYNIFITPDVAILSAAFGYMFFYVIAKLFYLVTHKHGLGYGDFKLYALFGAWLGIFMIPQIAVISSISALIAVLLAKLFSKRQLTNNPIPYGPFIVFGGYIALLWGNNINDWYLQTFIF